MGIAYKKFTGFDFFAGLQIFICNSHIFFLPVFFTGFCHRLLVDIILPLSPPLLPPPPPKNFVVVVVVASVVFISQHTFLLKLDVQNK